MNKKLILSLLTVAVVVAAVQFAEPASAATVIDSGKKNVVLSEDNSAKTGYWYYKTWNKGYYLHTYINGYLSGYGHLLYANIYMKKISSSKMKYTLSYKFVDDPTKTYTYYISTTKSATSWYWNRPLIDKIKVFGYYTGGTFSYGWSYPL